MAKQRIYARLPDALNTNVRKHAEKLGMKLNDYMIQALGAHIGCFNVLQQLTVAEQQVSELRKQCDLLEKDKTSLTIERDEARKQRDTFKSNFEEKVSELEVCEDKVRLLLGRSLWDRIINALPWVEAQED